MHSYICIVAFHLGTIDVPREGCDVGTEPEDGEWWTRLEDGQMDPDVHDRRKMLADVTSRLPEAGPAYIWLLSRT